VEVIGIRQYNRPRCNARKRDPPEPIQQGYRTIGMSVSTAHSAGTEAPTYSQAGRLVSSPAALTRPSRRRSAAPVALTKNRATYGDLSYLR
jgi:hypothetical protein